MTNFQTHYRTCNLCEAMCGLVITTQNEQIQTIVGDEKDPLSHGHICPKALAYKEDRKSTRLNSSHALISYAVFCLKKKRQKKNKQTKKKKKKTKKKKKEKKKKKKYPASCDRSWESGEQVVSRRTTYQ